MQSSESRETRRTSRGRHNDRERACMLACLATGKGVPTSSMANGSRHAAGRSAGSTTWRPGPSAAAAASNRRHYSWCTAQHTGGAHVWEQHPDTDRFPVRQGLKFPGGVVALDRPICRHMTRIRSISTGTADGSESSHMHYARRAVPHRHAMPMEARSLVPLSRRPAAGSSLSSLAIDPQDCHLPAVTTEIMHRSVISQSSSLWFHHLIRPAGHSINYKLQVRIEGRDLV
jgi:hypothetical protein